MSQFELLPTDAGPRIRVVIKPVLANGYILRFVGWRPFQYWGDDIPSGLDQIIAMRSAGRCFGALAGELLNSERQQNIDTGRVITYQDALQQAAYYEQRYVEAIRNDPTLVRSAPRAARR